MNEEKADYSKLFAKSYVSSVKNRIHELENPSKIDQMRWIWELIQNAKDCSREIDLSSNGSNKRKPVDVKLIYDTNNNILIFKHNGYPFTNDTLNSIMYKCSSKDEDDGSTGHFGTGFMSTHSLSLIVQIKAPYISEKGGKQELKRVNATIYREGKNDKKLLEEFKKMEDSRMFSEYDENDEEHKWTTFIYDLTKSNFGEQSAKLGIDSFRKNICKVLCFCNDINSIQFNEEEPIFSSTDCLKQQKTIDGKVIEIIEKSVKYENEEKFIVISSEEINHDYSRRYAKIHDLDLVDKKFKVRIAFQIDENKQIKKQTNNDTCLFCTFPLIGSENYQLPYFVDCPHFDTMTERNGIYLDGPKLDSKKGLTNTGLNHLILNRSIDLFEIGINWLIDNEYSCFSSLSNGLIKNSYKMDPFTNKICSILMKSPFIHNSRNSKVRLSDMVFLDFDNIENHKEFHELASSFYTNIASYDECIEWKDAFFKDLHVLTINKFLTEISHIGSDDFYLMYDVADYLKKSNKLFTNKLNSLKKQDFSFLNRLYSFLVNEPDYEEYFKLIN